MRSSALTAWLTHAGFVLIDDHQRNPKYPNIFAVGVWAIAPTEPTLVPYRRPQDRLHDRIHGHRHGTQHTRCA